MNEFVDGAMEKGSRVLRGIDLNLYHNHAVRFKKHTPVCHVHPPRRGARRRARRAGRAGQPAARRAGGGATRLGKYNFFSDTNSNGRRK